MSKKPYVPQAGSTAARACAALASLPPGTRLRSAALAKLMGISQENLGKKLSSAVDAGLLQFDLVHTKAGEWSLPLDPEVEAAQDAIARRLIADAENLTFGRRGEGA